MYRRKPDAERRQADAWGRDSRGTPTEAGETGTREPFRMLPARIPDPLISRALGLIKDTGRSCVLPVMEPGDEVSLVSREYRTRVLLSWGDPVLPGSDDFLPGEQSSDAQATRFGYNSDFCGWFHLGPGRGLLFVNHKYTNPRLMFADYDPDQPERHQVDVEIAAHGATIIELQKTNAGWDAVQNSPFNRRITGFTPIMINGPARGHTLMRTSEDLTGCLVNGMFNNCSGGKTPWGTVLTAEKDFDRYFANLSDLPPTDPRRKFHERYGLAGGPSERRWENHHDRFDVSKEPNEPFRHGWLVEIDPARPYKAPVKRTALGRFRHQGIACAAASSGQVVVYSGDDSLNEYLYKYVSRDRLEDDELNPGHLLDEGTLYAACFYEDKTGEWLPLLHGTGPLTKGRGFRSQADVLLHTRQAADRMNPTPLDRVDDVSIQPRTKKVLVSLRQRRRRQPSQDEGYFIEISESGNDLSSRTFLWSAFRAGEDEGHGQGDDIGGGSRRPHPLRWMPGGSRGVSTIRQGRNIYSVPDDPSDRGYPVFVRQQRDHSVCAPELTPDNKALFLSVDDPGEFTNGGQARGQSPTIPAVIIVESKKPSPPVGELI